MVLWHQSALWLLFIPFASNSPANTINFGGALGANIADIFNLNPSTGSGTQSLGSSNLFSVLELNNVSSGSATALGSPEYRGIYTQSDAVTYSLLGEKRQVYSDSEVSSSTQAFGIKTTLPNLSGVPVASQDLFQRFLQG